MMAAKENYEYNEIGVCLNPSVIKLRSGRCAYFLKTSAQNGVWYAGYELFADCDAGMCPCSCRARGHFLTQKEAFRFAASKALEFFNEKHYVSGNHVAFVKVPKDIFNGLQNILVE